MEAIAVVLEALKSVCSVYDEDFKDVFETIEYAAGELLRKRFI